MTRGSDRVPDANRALYIRTFGQFAARFNHEELRVSRHGAGLLAYLASQLDKPVLRGKAAALLWSHDNEKKGRHSLSQLIYSLSFILPKGALQSDLTSISLSSRYVASDVDLFLSAMRQGDLVEALSLYEGTFLEAMPFLTEEYDDWRLEAAASTEAAVISVCVGLITDGLEQEDHQKAAEIARRALLIAPANEYFARIRIESLAASGDIGGALRELESAKKRHLIETGSVPATLTDTLATRITRLPALSRPTDTGLPSRFVGRTHEIRLLRGEWESAKSSFRVAVIRGEPGIGKSRLLQHSARWAVLDGARSFMYSCSEVESRLPYSGIVGLLRDGNRRSDLQGLDLRWRRALAAIAPELVDTEDAGEHSQRIIWEAVARYFAFVASNEPVVIGLDDYHWIDDASREMLIYLYKRLPEARIHLIVAGRGSISAPTYEDDAASAVVLDLLPLGKADTEALVAEFEATHKIAVDTPIRRLLVDEVGGRPFFLLEALRHVRDSGRDLPASKITADLMSPNLGEHFKRRFGGLSLTAQAVSAVIAIVNRDVPLALLAKVVGVTVLEAAAATDELVRNGILTDISSSRFVHALVREAALSMLTAAQKRVWHLRLAATLPEYETIRLSEIADHLEAGGDSDAAYSTAEQAALEALADGAYADAEAQYHRMLRCAKPHQAVRARAGIVKLLASSGRLKEVQQYLTDVDSYFNAHADHEGMVACALSRYWLSEQEGHLSAEESLAQAKHIIELAERYTPHQLTSVLWQVSDTMRRSGEFEYLARFTRALELGSTRTDGGTAADMLAIAALMSGSVEGHQRSLELANRAVEIAEQTDDPALILRATYARGTARFWSGDVGGALDDYGVLLAADAGTVPDPLAARVKSNYAVLLMEQGDYENAELYAQAALREAGAVRRTYAFGNLALIHLRRGDWEKAKKYANALLAAKDTTPQLELHAQALLGLIDVSTGDRESAHTRHDFIAASPVGKDGLGDSSHIFLLQARLAELEGDGELAIAILGEGVRAIGPKEVIARMWLELEVAERGVLHGRQEEALALLSRIASLSEAGQAWAVNAAAHALLQSVKPIIHHS